MGGLSTDLRIERLGPGEGSTPRELHEALWEYVESEISEKATRGGNEQVTSYYLHATASDGFADDVWGSSETALHFHFGDAAGLCAMSCAACLHWLEVMLAADSLTVAAIAERHGWRLAGGRPSAARLLREGAYAPLVHASGNLYRCFPRTPGGKLDGELTSDDGIPSVEAEKLAGPEQEDALIALHTGRCGCQICDYARGLHAPDSKTGKRGDILPAWDLLEAEAALEAQALAEALAWSDDQWAAGPAGPPALQVLFDRLEDRGIHPPVDLLASMLFSRARRRR